jgi:S-DNA-T family DNA segregation ATPase FtsK/SpoIIIE
MSRAGGFLLLVAVAGSWASMLTWSQSDPSLTHAATGAPRNALGAGGAIFADVMLNTLGFASVFVLLAPMFWGIELMLAGRILANRRKTSVFPIALLLLAGGFAALPISANWPFGHSLGGIVGDWVYKVTATVFSLASAERMLPLAALGYFIGGFATLGYSIGLEREDVQRFIERSRSVARRREQDIAYWRARAEWLLGLFRAPVEIDDGLRAAPAPEYRPEYRVEAPYREEVPPTLGSRREPHLPLPTSFSLGQAPAHPRAAAPSSALGMAPAASAANATTVPWGPLQHAPQQHAHQAHMNQASGPQHHAEVHEHDEFDVSTDFGSRAMAARFAPAAGKRPQEADAHDLPAPAPVRVAPQVIEQPEIPAPAPQPPRKGKLLGGFAKARTPEGYRAPPLTLLRRAGAQKANPELTLTAMRGTARLLEEVLADFSIKGEVREIKPGPVITLFELEPARGTKSSRVVALAEDIARSMSVTSARAAVVPGRSVIGIELPNVRRETVYLRDILESDAFRAGEMALPMALGKSIGGEPIVVDLARMPHLLVAGTTGSGKSVGVNAMVLSLIFKRSPEECRFLMIDPKMLELSVYNNIPHLLTPVVTDPHKAVAALNWAVSEMEERYKRMASLSVRNIETFNSRVRAAMSRGERLVRRVQTGFDQETGEAVYEQQEIAAEPLPYIVIVVDEFADLMIVAGKEIEAAVQRLAQMARAAGIHLIMATQRPSVDIVTGTIKANFPARISFKVSSKIDSRTILNEQGAEQLLGQGDMLYSLGSGQIVRAHGPYVSDEEVEHTVEALRRQGQPRYVDGITEAASRDERSGAEQGFGGEDELFEKAVAIVLRDRKASTSYLQRRLSIGYNRAADLVERMEREGLIGPANNVGKREILYSSREAGSPGSH